MTVAELIEKLSEADPDMQVKFSIYDIAPELDEMFQTKGTPFNDPDEGGEIYLAHPTNTTWINVRLDPDYTIHEFRG